jgi:hypothetical protein
LNAPFAGAGMPGKNIEDDGGAIDDAHIEGFFEVTGLSRGKFFVKHHQIEFERFFECSDFCDFAWSDVILRKCMFEALVNLADDIDIGGVNQQG